MSLRALLAIACMATLAHAHPGAHDASSQQGSTSTARPTTVPAPKERAARLYFSEQRLMTQHGMEVALFSEVLKGRVVLVNSIFTQCRDSCSLQSLKLSHVQTLLGQSMGKDVHFVSISVDPERDTPEVLNRYARQFNAGAGWTFLTGKKESIDKVLHKFDQLVHAPEAHSTLFILGNVNTGHWIKLHPDSTPDEIAGHLRQLALETAAGSNPGSQ